ncbi:acyltransferase family protein [Telluria aromaticivorans]|uniref:Acyltransferase n=1 Tax=Telluria aromaticivorans TaxID=2725995 RepID=A0A7Y2NYI4_9BURK|nr:acyltransferase family protein [Telluria aromaticivorans]NNG22093.1 acyltransferase [Telluria aromaticivorans]
MSSLQDSLDRPFSLYLDLTRLLAAVAVVLAHFRYNAIIPDDAWSFLPYLGREAVIVFFVLSGYVIAASTAQRRPSARDYAVARLSRVYSVVLPVLFLALACAAALRAWTGSVGNAGYVLDKLYVYLPFHLLFLGQHWQLTEVPPLMIPYWSLGYEAWYYLLFGLACYLRGTRRKVAIALVLAIMGYKMWLLLPVWLSGAWLYRHYRAPLLAPRAARLGWLATLLVFGLYVGTDAETALRAAGTAWWPFDSLPLGSADRFLADYVVCAIVLANFACARDAQFSALVRHAQAWRLAASHTFTLYLSHSLVIALWLALYPHDPRSSVDILGLGVAIVVVTVALGAVTERRPHLYRALFGRLLGAGRSPPLASAAVREPRG